MLSTKKEIVDCLYRYEETDGSISSVNLQGLKISDKYVITIDSEGYVIYQISYQIDNQIIIDVDSKFCIGIHIQNIGDPEETLSIEMVNELSAVDFMKYLTTLYWR
ncbi:hypothetical protein [Bacillus sp. Marseille-P3661]|uniref:hypothetical protein n=1 Tax=Bacillus sp. Marseille-P3661 TaxID=1936234 RepID=UPI000C8316CC|nr:hypothetical protein [Bacillus sp. Marseille-P3661]